MDVDEVWRRWCPPAALALRPPPFTLATIACTHACTLASATTTTTQTSTTTHIARCIVNTDDDDVCLQHTEALWRQRWQRRLMTPACSTRGAIVTTSTSPASWDTITMTMTVFSMQKHGGDDHDNDNHPAAWEAWRRCWRSCCCDYHLSTPSHANHHHSTHTRQ